MRIVIQNAAWLSGADSAGRAWSGSLALHGALAAMIAFSGYLHLNSSWGSPKVSSGSVGVKVVKSIPIAQKEATENPLASDTQSVVPQAAAPVKFRKQVVEAPKNAIAIPDKIKPQAKPSPKPQSLSAYRPPVAYRNNQVYSNQQQAASSAIYGTRGTGGIDLGPASVLGSRFGAYVDLMRDRISQHWNTADVHALPSQKCAVSFTIARDGTISDVKISQASGAYLLDTSARRAVLDASPLPALPREFTGNDATVELWFQVHQ